VITVVALSLAGLALFNHYKEADKAYQASKHRYEQSKLIIGPDVTAHTDYTGDKAYREQWRAEQDLKAQREMARTSWWIMVWTFCGVFLLFYTVLQAQAMNAAAFAAIEQTRKASERELRSLLFVKRVEQSIIDPSFFGCLFDDGRYKIRVQIENIGKTPAIEVDVFAIVRVSDGESQTSATALQKIGFIVPKSTDVDEQPSCAEFQFSDFDEIIAREKDTHYIPEYVFCTIYIDYHDEFSLEREEKRHRSADLMCFGRITDELLERSGGKLD